MVETFVKSHAFTDVGYTLRRPVPDVSPAVGQVRVSHALTKDTTHAVNCNDCERPELQTVPLGSPLAHVDTWLFMSRLGYRQDHSSGAV